MKDKATKNGVKKPIFKKWWFWVIVVVILAAIFGNTGTKDSVEDGAKDTISSAALSLLLPLKHTLWLPNRTIPHTSLISSIV